jgi:hypothetical protein
MGEVVLLGVVVLLIDFCYPWVVGCLLFYAGFLSVTYGPSPPLVTGALTLPSVALYLSGFENSWLVLCGMCCHFLVSCCP